MSYVAFQFPVYAPSMYTVINITNSNPAVVTTSLDGINPAANNYINGLIIRIDMAPGYGMQEINQQFGAITVLSPSTFSIAIDTTLFSTFTTPATYPQNAQFCQANSFAELTTQITGALNNVLATY